MKFSFYNATLQGALKQRDLALWTCVGLSVANIAMVLTLINTEEKWVLIPQHDLDHRIQVTSSSYSQDYFIDWAQGVVGTILNVNPDSIDFKNHQILKMTVQNYGPIKERLIKEAELIKKDQISTVFYPKHFKLNKASESIDVSGQHIAYFGRDSMPVVSEKTFRITWAVRAHGIILLKDFQELKDE